MESESRPMQAVREEKLGVLEASERRGGKEEGEVGERSEGVKGGKAEE
jgi:hypothetical protein